MSTMTVRLQGIPETEASLGWAGSHFVVVDRPDGKAGGKGLGFNGGELLGLAVAGCFFNDLHYVAHEMGVRLASVALGATVTFEGSPLLATSVAVRATVEAADEHADLDALLRRAEETSTVSRSISRGVPVSVSSRHPGDKARESASTDGRRRSELSG